MKPLSIVLNVLLHNNKAAGAVAKVGEKMVNQKNDENSKHTYSLTKKEYKRFIKYRKKHIEPRRVVIAEFWLGILCFIGGLTILFWFDKLFSMKLDLILLYFIGLVLAGLYCYAVNQIHIFIVSGLPKYLGNLTVMENSGGDSKKRPLKDEEIDVFLQNIEKYTETEDEKEAFLKELKKTKKKRAQHHTFKQIIIYSWSGGTLIIGCYKVSKLISAIIYFLINNSVPLLYYVMLVFILLLLSTITFLAYNTIKIQIRKIERE